MRFIPKQWGEGWGIVDANDNQLVAYIPSGKSPSFCQARAELFAKWLNENLNQKL